MALVVDCSVAAAWCFKDETTAGTAALARRAAREDVVVPSVWRLEIANVLVHARRRGRVTDTQIAGFLDLLARLRVTEDEETSERAWTDIMSLARTHGMTAYDAAYLELASRRGLELATLDDALVRAAPKVGVAIVML